MPGISGLGNDLVRIGRFRAFLQDGKAALLERLFTEEERQYCLSKKDPAPHLAARFAAKEAFLKALGTGLRHGIGWHDMAVVREASGKPGLILRGEAARRFDGDGHARLMLSLSHDGDYAMATVVLETDQF